MLTHKEQSLLDAIEPRAQAEGIEIVTIEIVGAKKAPTIRVYIDTDHGVGFDELSSAQAWMGDLMDEIDPFPGAYTLEVSSPGIDRPLRTIEHFERLVPIARLIYLMPGLREVNFHHAAQIQMIIHNQNIGQIYPSHAKRRSCRLHPFLSGSRSDAPFPAEI